jgi:phospholipid/cholesterol/gamma-HCH transport system substrate-binding protein
MRSSNPFKAGLFIVVSFAIAMTIFFGVTGSELFSGPRQTYAVVFDLTEDVGGLNKGSDVRIGGLKVGAVKSIDVVDVDGKSMVQATFTVPTKYVIKSDAIITVQAGLTGTVNLNITDLGTGTVATMNDRLDGQPGALAIAIDSLGGVGDELTSTLQQWRPRVTGVLDDVRPRMSKTLDQLHTTAVSANDTILHIKSKIDPGYEKYAGVADNAKGAMANLNDILGDTKGDFRQTMANLSAMTGSLKERIPVILDKVADSLDDVRGSLAKISRVLDETRATIVNAKDVTASIRSLVNGNRSRLDEIIKSANLTSANIAAASSEIRHAPWRLLYKPSENEVANQNLYDATRQFAEASRKLQDSAQALRDSINDPDADQEKVQMLLDKLTSDFEGYQKVEKALWERVKK